MIASPTPDEPNTSEPRPETPPEQPIDRAARKPDNCPICGAVMNARQCKLTCPNCGYTEDCSDLFPD